MDAAGHFPLVSNVALVRTASRPIVKPDYCLIFQTSGQGRVAVLVLGPLMFRLKSNPQAMRSKESVRMGMKEENIGDSHEIEVFVVCPAEAIERGMLELSAYRGLRTTAQTGHFRSSRGGPPAITFTAMSIAARTMACGSTSVPGSSSRRTAPFSNVVGTAQCSSSTAAFDSTRGDHFCRFNRYQSVQKIPYQLHLVRSAPPILARCGLPEIPLCFQWLPIRPGDSARHGRDMK
ncbi:hypothetical protein [Bradyrhizobium sp. ARR65]|uniref:hypothetical protein n=1 Tax=Bradyrhizobium sp. ARR65 TaxID=1040989 RepID=UPI000A966CC0|nr:hypothetical protein [Bradyrhizobium sp. ARR65]